MSPNQLRVCGVYQWSVAVTVLDSTNPSGQPPVTSVLPSCKYVVHGIATGLCFEMTLKLNERHFVVGGVCGIVDYEAVNGVYQIQQFSQTSIQC